MNERLRLAGDLDITWESTRHIRAWAGGNAKE